MCLYYIGIILVLIGEIERITAKITKKINTYILGIIVFDFKLGIEVF